MKEYIVTVHDPKVWDQGLWDEIINHGRKSDAVPLRPVMVANERPVNPYCAHFHLSPEEAVLLKSDPRVKNVELKTSLRKDIELTTGNYRPTYKYDKSNTTVYGMKNWGVARGWSKTNNFGTATSINYALPYTLDGADVDIIVVDTGIAEGHPEFAWNADGSGGTRVVNYDWYSLGIYGTKTAGEMNGYLGDSDGHGSNCASIAAGNTTGWAPKANLYSIRIFEGYDMMENYGRYLYAQDIDIVFDLVTAFHLEKKARGIKRPTICTNSWGYSTKVGYYYATGTYFRGDYNAGSSWLTVWGQVSPANPVRVDSIDAAVKNCADAGVILVGAAGNSTFKCDVPGGLDWDNYYDWYYSSEPYYNGSVYYNRGGTPSAADGMICVGAMDNTTNLEQKVYFSCSGPRVDVYAPGVMIMGAYSARKYVTNPVTDPRMTNWIGVNPYSWNKISGTSQACPQVAGYLALVAQARPDMTAEEARAFVIGASAKGVLQNTTGDFYNFNALQEGYNRVLYMPFNSADRGSIRVNLE